MQSGRRHRLAACSVSATDNGATIATTSVCWAHMIGSTGAGHATFNAVT